MVWYSESARWILLSPTPTPAGDKPPRYIFSFRHRPSVYKSARFARGEPASRLIGGHILVPMTLRRLVPLSLNSYAVHTRRSNRRPVVHNTSAKRWAPKTIRCPIQAKL